MRQQPMDSAAREDGGYRPVQTGRGFSRKVLAMEGDWIVSDGNQFVSTEVSSGLLSAFLNLSNAKKEKLLDFGQKWGSLCIDAQRVPKLRFKERLSDWQAHARHLSKLHQIGVAVNASDLRGLRG